MEVQTLQETTHGGSPLQAPKATRPCLIEFELRPCTSFVALLRMALKIDLSLVMHALTSRTLPNPPSPSTGDHM